MADEFLYQVNDDLSSVRRDAELLSKIDPKVAQLIINLVRRVTSTIDRVLEAIEADEQLNCFTPDNKVPLIEKARAAARKNAREHLKNLEDTIWMSHTRAFYSIIQYIPDTGRAEVANVGVLLLVPGASLAEPAEVKLQSGSTLCGEYVFVRTSDNLQRVSQFFAPNDDQLQRIRLAIGGLVSRLSVENFTSEEELTRFAAASADFIRLTPPKLALVSDPLLTLNELFDELVD